MLALEWREDIKCYDFVDDQDGFKQDDTLRTAQILSVQIHAPGVSISGEIKHGYWAEPSWGSNFWELYGEPMDDEILSGAEDRAESCMQWMLDEGIVDSIDASTVATSSSRTDVEVTLSKGGGVIDRFTVLYDNTKGAVIRG